MVIQFLMKAREDDTASLDNNSKHIKLLNSIIGLERLNVGKLKEQVVVRRRDNDKAKPCESPQSSGEDTEQFMVRILQKLQQTTSS